MEDDIRAIRELARMTGTAQAIGAECWHFSQ